MSLIRIDPNPSRRQLAVFGIIWLAFFSIIGLIVLMRGGSLTLVTLIWIAGVLAPAIGWIVPEFMRIVYLGMAYLAYPIGFVVSYLLLLAIYYLVLTPTGLLMRMLRYDPMDRWFDRDAKSYWAKRRPQESIEHYFRQS